MMIQVPIRKLLTFSIILSFIVTLVSCGTSRRTVTVEEGWEILGESKVNFIRDMDEIEVRSRNQYTAIRFLVEDREIRLNDLRIIYENGDKLEPNVDEVIPADQYSRTIELARDGRYIDRIEFKYRTTGNILKGRAKVLVIGKRYNLYGY